MARKVYDVCSGVVWRSGQSLYEQKSPLPIASKHALDISEDLHVSEVDKDLRTLVHL